MLRKAIIDIGTNTINLLILEVENKGTFQIIFEEKLTVKLGKGSMQDDILKPGAINRAIDALHKHLNTAEQYNVRNINAFATSAVRNAKNKHEFIASIKHKCNLDIHIISGDKEARLIYQGVKQAVSLIAPYIYLILDIGGGSNEFILCDYQKILWKKSYDLGIARLLEIIHPDDPISQQNIMQLKQVTDELTKDLFLQCQKYHPEILVGASGSFETYFSMILQSKYNSDELLQQHTCYEISMADFNDLYDQLIKSDRLEREKIPGLPHWRIDMIVLAIVFTKYILEQTGIQKIIFSDYALKEGVMLEDV